MNEDHDKEPLSEEEFLELVLHEQEKALAQAREERKRRAQGQATIKRKPFRIRIIAYVAAFVLLINALALFLEVYSIPAVDFMKASATLSQQQPIRDAKEAIVEIRSENSKGTGFSVSADGWIVTNEHVIDDALSLTVSFPSHGIYEAEVIASFPEIDSAILKIETTDAPFVSLAAAPTYIEEAPITFIGNPLSFSMIANEGVLKEPILLEDWSSAVYAIDAPVYKGNSGSPVFNEDMDVIGMIFATMSHSSLGKVGLFIPIETLLDAAPPDVVKAIQP
ncbi:MAG: serine protease [Caryophanon sp.]|nr:serine protease [Caryophanon sp.]